MSWINTGSRWRLRQAERQFTEAKAELEAAQVEYARMLLHNPWTIERYRAEIQRFKDQNP